MDKTSKLRPFRNSEDESLLDKLYEERKLLAIEYCKENNADKRKKISKEIAVNTEIINEMRGYERYDEIVKAEQELRQILERLENIVEDYQNKLAVKVKEGSELLEIRNSYKATLEQLKLGHELNIKVDNLKTELGLSKKINESIDEKAVMTYLDILDFIKREIIEERNKLETEIDKEKTLHNELTEKLHTENEIWNQLIDKKTILEDKLMEVRRKKLDNEMITNRNTKIRESSKIKENFSTSSSPSHIVVQRSVNHNKIPSNNSIPLHYAYWFVGLLFWIILLCATMHKEEEKQEVQEVISECL